MSLIGWFGTFVWFPLVIWHLATGWLRHLFINLPHLRWNPTTITLSLAAAAIALFLLHRFVRGLLAKPLRATVTVRAAGIFLAATAAAIAMTGIVHELAWLARSPLTYDRSGSARTETISNGKQLFLVLLELDQEGIHPHSVEEVLDQYPGIDDIVSYPATYRRNGYKAPFVLFHPGISLSKLPPDAPLIGALGRSEDRIVVVLVDGSAERLTPQELEQRLAASP